MVSFYKVNLKESASGAGIPIRRWDAVYSYEDFEPWASGGGGEGKKGWYSIHSHSFNFVRGERWGKQEKKCTLVQSSLEPKVQNLRFPW
jgi:hypothetical protein